MSADDLVAENTALRARLEEAEETLRAIRSGEVDALLVATSEGDRIFTLQGAEHAYRVLVETMNEGAVTAMVDGTILYCNSRFAAMVKAAPETIVGSALPRYVAPEDRMRIEALMNLSDQTHRRGEVQLTCGDGTSIPVLFSFSPAAVEGLPGICVIATDLSGQKRTEQMMASEKLARSIFEQASEAIVVCDREGKVIRANLMANDLAGCNPLMKPVETVFPFITDCSGEAAHDNVNPASPFLSRDEALRKEMVFRRSDGSQFDLLYSTAPIEDEAGRRIGCCITLVDITRMKHVEQQLRRSEQRLNLAIEGARLGVWDKDLITGEVITEAHWGSLLGYGPGDPILPWEEHVHPDDRSGALENFRDHIRGKTPYAEASYRMKTREGGYVWILTRGTVVGHDEQGRPRRMTGVDQDITALRISQEALKEASAKLNLLSSITRHDILNQVMALKGFLWLVEERHCEDSESVQMVSKMNQITDSIHRLIAFTGDYQHMGERDPVWQQVTPVVNRAAKSVMLGGATLTVSTGSREVFADPMLEKVFYNLLDNAVAHGGDVTAIGVSCHEEGEDLVIVMEDDGAGVPASMKEAIFHRGVGKNTGFGLFLTKEILGITGMAIKETGDEGKGARFEITVPGDRWRMAGH